MSFVSNIVDVGADSNMGGQHMYRQWYGEQQQVFVFDIDGITINAADSRFIVWYKEWYLAEDDTVIGLQRKYYVIADVDGHPNFTNRMTQLWRGFIPALTPGIATAIETVLAALPFEVPNGYVLNS